MWTSNEQMRRKSMAFESYTQLLELAAQYEADADEADAKLQALLAKHELELEREREQELIFKTYTPPEQQQIDTAPDTLDDDRINMILDIIGEEVGTRLNNVLQKIAALDARISSLEAARSSAQVVSLKDKTSHVA
jgi:hypothetical protein